VIETFRTSLRLLGTRRFGTFWFASLLSSMGTWAQQVAEPWLMLNLGASSLLIGLDSFAMNAPMWLLTFVGGVLADRSDRRRVITLFQSIQMLCPTAIVVLLVTGTVSPWWIIALSLVVGITDALSLPSFQSIVPSIVSREQIGAGLALNSTQFNLSRVLGPSLAGVLISSFGMMACFVVSALSYIPFIGIALWILPKRCARPPAAVAPPRLRILAGIREIVSDKSVRCALLTVLSTSMFCAPLITFAPVLVKETFHGSAGQYSLAVAAFGVGGMLGAFALLGVSPSIDRRLLTVLLAFACAATLMLVAIVPWFAALPVLLLLAGLAVTVSNTAANTLLQATAKPNLLGQTVSLYMLALRGGMSLGAVITGALVTLLGVRSALLLDGVLAAAALSFVLRSWPRSTAVETHPEPSPVRA
jgi:MFS family permease